MSKRKIESNLSKNFAAVMIGIALSIVLVIVVDKVFGWVVGVDVGKSNLFPYLNDSEGLGWGPQHEKSLIETVDGFVKTHTKERDGSTIFDVTYNYDSLYRRKVPQIDATAPDKFVLFFGGSQTFGLGLNDVETIPAQVQKGTSSYHVYNYAYNGYGPHQMLRKLEAGHLPDEIIEPEGVAFFQYFSFHVPRVLGTMVYINWAGGGAPYYRFDSEGELEYAGAFVTGRFWRTLIYWLIGKSNIVRHFLVDVPSELQREHYELVCAVLDQSRYAFLNQFPNSRFIVIIGMTNNRKDPIAKNCLEPKKIDYIDTRKHFKKNAGYLFPHDGHFTPKAAQLISSQLLPLLD